MKISYVCLQLGLEEILEIPNSLKQIAQALEFVTLEKKTAIFEFFAAACLMLEDSALVVEALDFYRTFQQDSFELLKEELRDNLDLKVCVETFFFGLFCSILCAILFLWQLMLCRLPTSC
jgi:hypothetical protein